MKRIALVTLALFSLSFAGFAGHSYEMKETQMTYSVSGTVLDMITGEALAGVRIQISDADTFTYSDFDGNFLIGGLLPGTYKLSTTYISYQANELEINLDPENLGSVEVKIGRVTK